MTSTPLAASTSSALTQAGTDKASDPAALIAFFKGLGHAVERIGLEAGPLSQWLYAGLTQAGFETVLPETRYAQAALSAMTVKTDRKDARGIVPGPLTCWPELHSEVTPIHLTRQAHRSRLVPIG